MKGYYCVQAFFKETELTMSVNVSTFAYDHDIIFERALYYFTKVSRYTVTAMNMYKNESDMHFKRLPIDSKEVNKQPK